MKKIALAASLLLALTFTIGCSDDSDDGPGSGSDGPVTAGVFIVRDIPPEFEGKYIAFEPEGGDDNSNTAEAALIFGGDNTSSGFIAVQISDGTASIPTWEYTGNKGGDLWDIVDDRDNLKRYSGNHSVGLEFYVLESTDVLGEDLYQNIGFKPPQSRITFSNGGANRSWKSLTDWNKDK